MKKIYLILLPFILLAKDICIEIGSSTRDIDKNYVNIFYEIKTPIRNLPTYTNFSVGGWEGKNSSHFISITEGIKYGDIFYTKIEIGISFLSDTTKNLSTSFQFKDKISLGYRFNDLSISINYIHFSNGGIKKPNRGENFIAIGFAKTF